MADGTQLTKWDEKLAEMAANATSMERVGGDFLSVKGGVLSMDGEALPGNQICVVILDAAVERTYYAQKYDATSERNAPPVCYAFAQDAAEQNEMGPHPTMQKDLSYFQPQSDLCATCPNNAWGSSDTGRGKACGERRRLALLPAGYYTPIRGSRDFELTLVTDPDHYASADLAYLKLPVTSVKGWAKYVSMLAASHRRPPAAVISRVWVEPDAKNQFAVKFEVIEELPSDMFDVIMARYEEANANIVQGYEPPSGEADGAPTHRSVRR